MEAYSIIPEWNELVFREPTAEEREEYAGEKFEQWIDNLPTFGEDVLVTNGIYVWIDSFDLDDGIYLSGSDSEVDDVTAWMPLPNPYKGGAHK